jgi:hypothetical protein
MSNTTCIKAIESVSHITEGTVNKLYNRINTPQPCSVVVEPINYHRMGRVVEAIDVLINSTVHALDRDDTDVYSYHIWGNVYVVYTKEGVSI